MRIESPPGRGTRVVLRLPVRHREEGPPGAGWARVAVPRPGAGSPAQLEALQPVSLLLDERGVDFGDRFSRDAVDAFAMDDELQCMAYSVSPRVNDCL